MDIQKFFISFNSLDQQKAHWIAWTLREEGHEVAVHDWEIPAGGNAPLWMNEKLAWADRLIAVVSPDYLSAKYSTIERAAALWEDPDGKKGAVVPVIVRPTSPLPPLMKGLSRIDLTGVSEEVARDRLLAGIRQPRPPLTKPVFNVVAPEKHEQGPSSKPAFSSVEETNVDTEAFEISPYDDTPSDMPGSIGESKKPGKKEGRLNWKSPLLRKILIGLGAVVLFTFIWYQGGVQEKLKNKIVNVSRSYLGHIAAQDFAALAEMAGTPFFFGEHVLDSRDAVQNYFMRMFELSQKEPQKEDELEFGPAMYRGTLFSRRAIEAAELPDFNFVMAGDIVTKLRIYSSDEQKKPTGPPPILDIGKNAARADIRFRAFKIENIDVIHLYFSTDENVPRLRGVLIR